MVQELTLVGNATYKFGLFYYEYQYESKVQEDQPLSIPWHTIAEVKISAYAILLPSLQGDETGNNYALVDNMWKALDGERNLVHPHVYLHREYSNTDGINV